MLHVLVIPAARITAGEVIRHRSRYDCVGDGEAAFSYYNLSLASVFYLHTHVHSFGLSHPAMSLAWM